MPYHITAHGVLIQEALNNLVDTGYLRRIPVGPGTEDPKYGSRRTRVVPVPDPIETLREHAENLRSRWARFIETEQPLCVALATTITININKCKTHTSTGTGKRDSIWSAIDDATSLFGN